MKSLLKIVAAAILAVGLTAGFASAATGTIDTTGPESTNLIRHNDEVTTDITVDNPTEVTGEVTQEATSGDAKNKMNTNGGDASSGDAENDADADVSVDNDNSGVLDCGCAGNYGSDNDATIDTTGYASDNRVIFENTYDYTVEVTNDTTVDVTVDQTAETGDAEVTKNTNAGDASTGNASNSSSLSISVSNKN